MSTDPALRDAMVVAIPRLRRFAILLSDAQQADDLVQETLLRAGDDWQAARKALVEQLTRLRDQFGALVALYLIPVLACSALSTVITVA